MQEMSRTSQHFTDSVIRRMTRIAIANNAINLAQGFPHRSAADAEQLCNLVFLDALSCLELSAQDFFPDFVRDLLPQGLVVQFCHSFPPVNQVTVDCRLYA